LFTVRPDNWNEKLGRVTSSEVAVVQGNHAAGDGPLTPITLHDFIKSIGVHGAYAGLIGNSDLSNDLLDQQCSIRFQTTFLPVSGARGTLEFATEAYNYNTRHDDDPRNLVLLCTSQGVAVQQDGEGAKRLFHHAVDEDSAIHRYWLEAERSDHKVGGQQKETAQERVDALSRGKATASVIGTKAMGTRFNVLMTIQVPLQQKRQPEPSWGLEMNCSSWGDDMDSCSEREEEECCEAEDCFDDDDAFVERCSSAPQVRSRGIANAARVSRGSEYDIWPGLGISNPERNTSEHVTVTVVIYNTVADGVPSEDDVIAAIDDLEDLYEKCSASGKLADTTFDFMKNELTVKDAIDIVTKVSTQPAC
jgi:huntingtin